MGPVLIPYLTYVLRLATSHFDTEQTYESFAREGVPFAPLLRDIAVMRRR